MYVNISKTISPRLDFCQKRFFPWDLAKYPSGYYGSFDIHCKLGDAQLYALECDEIYLKLTNLKSFLDSLIQFTYAGPGNDC